MGFTKPAMLLMQAGRQELPSCAQPASVLSGVMGVGLRCQEARLEEEAQISFLLKLAGETDGKSNNRGSGAETIPRSTGFWEAGAGTAPTRAQAPPFLLHPSHLIAAGGDLDRHIQGLVRLAIHRLQQGHESWGGASPVLDSLLPLLPRRLGGFLQKKVRARLMQTQGKTGG